VLRSICRNILFSPSLSTGFYYGSDPVVHFYAGALCTSSPELTIPAFGGLTSGVIALAINAAIYLTAAFVVRQPKAETDRVDDLFKSIGAARVAREPLGVREGGPAPQPS
jgi:hypothetical protein